MGFESPYSPPDLLQQILLTLYPRENCTELYNAWSETLKFTDDMVCVGRGVDAKGLCQVCARIWNTFSLLLLLAPLESAYSLIFGAHQIY